MMHRLVLMLSAILMMFAIFGFVMWIGALEGDNEKAAFGNMVLCFVMTFLMSVALGIGMRMRKSMNERAEAVLTELFASVGYVDAVVFADRMGVSLDDARDMLDKRARDRRWLRTEFAHYDARYSKG
jgi:uncharacterized membrane protein YeiB